MKQILVKEDGGKVIENCTFKRAGFDYQRVETGQTQDIPLPPPSGAEPTESTVRMCQTYKVLQPQRRSSDEYECTYHMAESVTTAADVLWWIGVAVGVVGTIVLTGGAAIAVWGPATAAGAATAAIGIGAGMATVGFGGASLIPTGEDVDDYTEGKLLGTDTIVKKGQWGNDGPAELGDKVGDPHPC